VAKLICPMSRSYLLSRWTFAAFMVAPQGFLADAEIPCGTGQVCAAARSRCSGLQPRQAGAQIIDFGLEFGWHTGLAVVLRGQIRSARIYEKSRDLIFCSTNSFSVPLIRPCQKALCSRRYGFIQNLAAPKNCFSK